MVNIYYNIFTAWKCLEHMFFLDLPWRPYGSRIITYLKGIWWLMVNNHCLVLWNMFYFPHVCWWLGYMCFCFIYLVGGFNHYFLFPFHIWDVILPIDFHIFQRGGAQPPTSRTICRTPPDRTSDRSVAMFSDNNVVRPQGCEWIYHTM